MSTWVAPLVAAAAITLTYVFCVRPMMHGRGRAAAAPAEDPEIAQLREELRVLHAQQEQQPQPSRARDTRSASSRDALGR